MMELMNKRIMVVGMARSGVAACELLLAQGARVVVNDLKGREAFGGALDGLFARGAEDALGVAPEQLLEGLDAIVLSPGVPIGKPFVTQARERGIEVIGELELGSRFVNGLLLAVTGTNGKTTTTTLLGEIFKNAGRTVRVAGNIGLPLCQIALDTKPGDVTVLEVSSFQLEAAPTLRPDCAAILNITEDHLNRHGTMECYTETKFRVFANQKAANWAVLNYDDAALREGGKGVTNARKVWFSATRRVSFGAWAEKGLVFFGSPRSCRQVCRVDEIYIPGKHNLENALAATAIAAVSGVQLPVIRHTLRTFQGVEHRIEFVREAGGVRYINDSKGTNVDSTIKAVECMTRPTVLMLGGYDKHTDFDPLSRVIAASGSIRRVIALGATGPQISDSLLRCGFDAVTLTPGTFAEALSLASDAAQPGWNVLLSPACASFDMFSDYEERGRVFKQLVARIGEDG